MGGDSTIFTWDWKRGDKGEVIISSGELVRELKRIEDNFITVEVENREYVIDMISHKPNCADSLCTHLVLKCKDGGNGEIKRICS